MQYKHIGTTQNALFIEGTYPCDSVFYFISVLKSVGGKKDENVMLSR